MDIFDVRSVDNGRGGEEVKIVGMSIVISETVNVGNFESIKVQTGIEADFVEGDDIGENKRILFKEAKKFLDESLVKLLAERRTGKSNDKQI
jgi:hypothetical protein